MSNAQPRVTAINGLPGGELHDELVSLRNDHQTLKSSYELLQTEVKNMEAVLETTKSRMNQLELKLEEARGYTLLQFKVLDTVDEDPIIGSFDTKEVKAGVPKSTTASKTIIFTRAHKTPPGIVIGLTMLDISAASDIRVSSYASNLLNNSFDINVDGAAEMELHGIACSWLEISAQNPGFQFGRFNTQDNTPWTKPGTHNNRNITFQRPYSSPPKVVVWLSAFDMDSKSNCAMGAYTTEITLTGFKIHLDTWGGTILNSVIVSWIAYPSGTAGVSSGTFDIVSMRPHECPQPYNSGYITFPAGHFAATPRVIAGIRAIDIDKKPVVRLKVSTSSVSATGMLWHLNAWDDTVLRYARADYIAFA